MVKASNISKCEITPFVIKEKKLRKYPYGMRKDQLRHVSYVNHMSIQCKVKIAKTVVIFHTMAV